MTRGDFETLSQAWFIESIRQRYSYRWTWMGRPIIQYPQDMIAMQEIIWSARPDLIVETGVAHGGSLVFYASLMKAFGIDGTVVGVEIALRRENRAALDAHPMRALLHLIDGPSTDPDVVAQVAAIARERNRVLVTLDSDHTHRHVLRELQLYSPFVTNGSYLVVFDTCVERLPKALFPDRPWGPGNNPMTAVEEFLQSDSRFVVDRDLDEKLMLSVAPSGYLRRIAP